LSVTKYPHIFSEHIIMVADLIYIGVKKYLAKSKDQEGFDDLIDPQQGGALQGINIIHLIIGLIAAIGAIYLSWRCNTAAGEGLIMKIVYAAIASFFSYFYLVFYLIYRVLMGNAC